jgi:hypothetical protein
MLVAAVNTSQPRSRRKMKVLYNFHVANSYRQVVLHRELKTLRMLEKDVAISWEYQVYLKSNNFFETPCFRFSTLLVQT